MHAIAHEIRKELTKYYKLYPGTKQVLSGLKRRRINIAVVSNGATEWVERQIGRFGLNKYFDFVVVSDQIGKEKSSLVPFRIALKKLGVKPDECLMVGDRIDEDMHAKKLGMWTCHATYGSEVSVGPKMKPDFRIKNLRELSKIIDKINKLD